MSSNMARAQRSDPVLTQEFPRPNPAKAGLAASDIGPDRTGQTFGSVAKGAVVKYYGSVKAAAYALGEKVGLAPLDPSLLMRELDAGKLGRLEVDPLAKAVVSEALHQAFARPQDPKAHMRRLVTDMELLVCEFRQFVEFTD